MTEEDTQILHPIDLGEEARTARMQELYAQYVYNSRLAKAVSVTVLIVLLVQTFTVGIVMLIWKAGP